MRSAGAAVVKRLDYLLSFLFLCILAALRLEFVACNVGKIGAFAVARWHFDRYELQNILYKILTQEYRMSLA